MKTDPPSPSLRRGKQFFAELKRRNVYKVAVAYAVVSWLLIQAASILFPTFEAPSWVMKMFVAIVLFGFPLALLFAWAFELTPEGLKRTEEVAPQQSISRKTGRKLIAFTATLAAVALALFVFQVVRSRSGARISSPATTTASSSSAAATPEKSIAVLPFENLSRDPENAFFASGIQDEILTALAKISGLKVISRKSTARYGSSPENLPEIARQLGVAHILEGSVQKAADKVHINLQLIRAETDAHVWAQTFDRSLADIFAVEADVPRSVAQELQAKLTPEEKARVETKPTENSDAYVLYLRANQYESRPSDLLEEEERRWTYTRKLSRWIPTSRSRARVCLVSFRTLISISSRQMPSPIVRELKPKSRFVSSRIQARDIGR